MQPPLPNPVRNVSDTALWVAMYRALETDRDDAIFRDRYARRLAGERGAAIVDNLPRARSMAMPMIVRTAVMDELVLRCVQEGCRTVLDLAAGLDTRPWRLQLPAAVHWIDADLPDMVAYKQEHMADAKPACSYEAVAIDLTDVAARRKLFARAASHGPVLAVAEGLLVYLPDAAVTELARDLHVPAGMRWWLIDIAAPKLLQMLNRNVGKSLRQANAPLLFAPAAGTAFFAPHGWREREFRSTLDESKRLRRTMRLQWLWGLLGRLGGQARREQFRRFSGIALLERT